MMQEDNEKKEQQTFSLKCQYNRCLTQNKQKHQRAPIYTMNRTFQLKKDQNVNTQILWVNKQNDILDIQHSCTTNVLRWFPVYYFSFIRSCFVFCVFFFCLSLETNRRWNVELKLWWFYYDFCFAWNEEWKYDLCWLWSLSCTITILQSYALEQKYFFWPKNWWMPQGWNRHATIRWIERALSMCIDHDINFSVVFI